MEMIKETAKVVRQQQIDEGIFDMELSFPKVAALAKPGQLQEKEQKSFQK